MNTLDQLDKQLFELVRECMAAGAEPAVVLDTVRAAIEDQNEYQSGVK